MRAILLAACALLCLGPAAFAASNEAAVAPAAAPATAPPEAATEAAADAPEKLALAAANKKTADVRLYNRVVATFRAPFFQSLPEERAENTTQHLRELLKRVSEGKVETKRVPQGRALLVDGRFALLLVPGDANAAIGESLDQAAKKAEDALRRVVEESRESRNLDTLLGSALRAGVATLIAVALVWLLVRVRGWIARTIASVGHRHAERLQVGGRAVVGREQVFFAARFITAAVFWLLAAFVAYEWLAYVMSRFPWTRPWGEGLLGAAFGLAGRIATGILDSLPNLAVAATIFWIAWVATRFVDRTLAPFIRGEVETARLDRDTARPTKHLLSAGIWVFAVAMAYPYLPGADSEAFKGLSVLVGLMISLGSTSLVGQGANGLILMFTRTLRPGEFVRIGEHEGTVVELGAFTTRIRTGLGEELTISNSAIASGTTKNYSRAVKGPGFIVDTTVTIGYDTPWRQVHAMLVEAARRTRGVLADPPPMVFQTGLSDFYPEYRLVAQAVPSEPLPRALVISELHAHIQDVFNEHGVQIMSPHYLGDPADAKIVPPAKWYAPPAKQPE